ncbi:MAG: peptidoglycan-binding protein [Bacteroidota bacterium]
MINDRSNVNRSSTQPLSRPGTTPLNPSSTQPLEQKSFLGKALGFVGDVFVGGGEAILDMGKGLVNTVLHPIQTVKGLAYVITHPAALVHAFVDPYTKAIKEGHPGKAVGRGIVEIGSLFIGPQEVVGAAKGVVNFFKGPAAGSAAAVASISGNSAQVATRLATQASAVESKAGMLAQAGHAAEAAKMGQYARLLDKTSAMARAGDVGRALKWANAAANAGTIKVAGQVMNMAGFLAKTDSLIAAASRLGKVAAFADKAFDMVGGAKSSAAGDVLKGAAKFVVKNPVVFIAPPLGVAVALGKMSKLPDDVDPQKLTPETAAELAKQYGLDPSLDNVKAFLGEVAGYKDQAIGPDTGNPEEIKQLQALLRTVGYDLPATGSWDEATAASVIDFKQKNGLQQGYKLANGQSAINEYVDHATAEVLFRRAQEGTAGASVPAPKPVSEQFQAIAEQYGLEATPENVKAFQEEIATYQDAVGPDSDAASIQKLQGDLRQLGYQVEANGSFDDATAEAVIAFKRSQGLHQNYRLATGDPAVNEYVDAAAARALAKELAARTPAKDAEPKPAEVTAEEPKVQPAEVKTEAPTAAEILAEAKAADAAARQEENVRAEKRYQVQRGDYLSKIAREQLGDANRWKELYELNQEQIGANPNLIRPGMSLKLPE